MSASLGSSPHGFGEGNPDEEMNGLGYDEVYHGGKGSGEETEDASESELGVKRPEEEFTEIKEQMYQDKLAQLKRQLQQLQEGTLPEYLKRLKRIEQQYKERLRMNDMWQAYCMEINEVRYSSEMKQSAKELEQKKIDLKERCIADWEEKRRQVESDKQSIELNSGTAHRRQKLIEFTDFKPISTRKLRRRPNPDGTPYLTGTQEKRRKQSPTINFLLDESDITEDLKMISKVSGKPFNRKTQPSSSNEEQSACDARIEDGKLYYEKRWYHRGQPIYAESKDTGKFGATISTVGNCEVWVRKTSDNSRVKILLVQLQKGKFTIRRRSA